MIIICANMIPIPYSPEFMKLALVFSCLCFLTGPAYAGDYRLTLKDNKFEPARLEVPSGEKISVIIHNQDATPAEFESRDLNREKIVSPNSEARILIGPLKPGTYDFFDDFHPKTATGTFVVK
jgi:plastocyanin